jgi:indolepyruvate ferredoxin oxidoreductase
MDPRFTLEQGTGIFTGNELLVKGALECGIGEITGYPGSPLAEFFDTLEKIRDLLEANGIVAQIANNEAMAAARLNGAQMASIQAMAVMKSVGMHVAADGLALGNMAGATPTAGALLVVGDDTWSEGTQVPADSRFLSQHLYMPVLEPSTFQEIKDWVGIGFELSRQTALYITYLVTSNQADGGGSVEVFPNRFAALNTRNRISIDTSAIQSNERVIIPPATVIKEQQVMAKRYPKLLNLGRTRGLNQILYPTPDPSTIGFITSGLSYTYLEHALHILGLSGHFPILKLGITYPLDPDLVATFAAGVEQLCVVEEKRPFIEPQVASILTRLRQQDPVKDTRLWGKHFPDGQQGFPSTMGLHPSLVIHHLARLFELVDASTVDRERSQRELAHFDEMGPETTLVPVRTPSFCPGCPHRDSASVLKKTAADFTDPDYMKKHNHEPTDLVFHGDIGCYSMLKYAPFSRLMHNLSGMGLGGATGAGIDPFIDNKQLVFMGDSTFFHTGITAISDSIKNNQDLTYVILDNKTTAMTGHQPTPGVGVDILGRPTFAQDIERVVRGLAGDSDISISRTDPAKRREYRRLIEKTLLLPGVKIVIADKECGITYQRRERAQKAALVAAQGFAPLERHINISEDVCEYCLECTKGTGCSGLTVNTQTNYGPKIAIDLSSCVTDGACTRVEVDQDDKTCPSFEEIAIYRQQPAQVELPPIDVGQLPEPKSPALEDTWYTYIAGVGGMGVNLVASVLAQAGVRQGYDVRLTNKKGLAIRNGSVYSHLSYAPRGQIISPLVPSGKANLLLGLDLLEAARGVDPLERNKAASHTHTTALINTAVTPTINTLIGAEDFSAEAMTALIRQHTNPEFYFGANLFKISETYLGNKVYANIMMLGVAYQSSLLPLDLENLKWAMKVAVQRDFDTNMKAFDMGRRLALDPAYFTIEEPPRTCDTLVAEKTALLRKTHSGRIAERYDRRLREVLAQLDLDEATRRHFALRVYDLIQYENFAYAEKYIQQVQEIYQRDTAAWAHAATRAAIYYLAKVMIIKDEVYVAYLLTCEEKYQRDRKRYNVDPARGDRVVYHHLTRPHFKLFGKDFRADLKTRDWQLRLVRKTKFLRRLFSSWWHREERDFIDWYADLLQRFDYNCEEDYRTWVKVLELPEEVRGYRSVRTPKMAAARRRAEDLLADRSKSRAPDLLDIEPAATISSLKATR